MANILAVDDNIELCKLIRTALERDGHRVETRLSGAELTEQLCHWADCILLDVMMPKMDGLEVCRRIRKLGNTPVMMLTAKGETFDKVLGLELGADDYMVKPFDTKEVVARIKAVLRRCARPAHLLHLAGLVLDQDAHTVSCDGQRVPLTYKEYELLRLLLSHPGMAFTRDQLMAQVWGTDYCGETRTVDMHIRTLRQKLGPYGSLIQTVRNVGYRLEEQE